MTAVSRGVQDNLFGPLKVTNAFVPLLKRSKGRSKGAIVNNLSLAALAALPMMPGYSISKATAFNMTQSLRALLAAEGVSVHAVVLGPIDTEMSRGLDVPKVSPESAAAGIFDGLERGEDEIFPDPASGPSPLPGVMARSAISRLSCPRPPPVWREAKEEQNVSRMHHKHSSSSSRSRVHGRASRSVHRQAPNFFQSARAAHLPCARTKKA